MIINRFKEEILRSKSLILITLISLFLFVPSLFATPNKLPATQEKVLGVTKNAPSPNPTPTPSPLPSPKSIVVASLVPTPTPAVTATPTPTPTTSASSSNSSPTAIPTPTPTPTPSPSPSPSPVALAIQIGVDYAGQKSNDSYTVSVNPGQKAWDAVVQAVGIDNIQYDQYDFGKFITGFNGISADPSSQYYEFKVNGAASVIGVSDYECKDGDVLDFVLTNFN